MIPPAGSGIADRVPREQILEIGSPGEEDQSDQH